MLGKLVTAVGYRDAAKVIGADKSAVARYVTDQYSIALHELGLLSTHFRQPKYAKHIQALALDLAGAVALCMGCRAVPFGSDEDDTIQAAEILVRKVEEALNEHRQARGGVIPLPRTKAVSR